MAVTKKIWTRNEEITRDYLSLLDQHIADIVEGRETEMLHINEIAQRMFISPVHLSNTIKLTTHHHPCYYYDFKIIAAANILLVESNYSASEVARRLTFDPSNFVKFYRSLTGITPTQFRLQKKLPDDLPIDTKAYQRAEKD